MRENKQKICNLVKPILREIKGLYTLLDLKYEKQTGFVRATFSTGVQKVIGTDGINGVAMVQKLLAEIGEEKVFPESDFEKFLEQQKQHVEEWKEEGLGYAKIICRLAGAVEATAGEALERSFTASQLKQIFDLTENGQNEEEHLHNAREGCKCSTIEPFQL